MKLRVASLQHILNDKRDDEVKLSFTLQCTTIVTPFCGWCLKFNFSISYFGFTVNFISWFKLSVLWEIIDERALIHLLCYKNLSPCASLKSIVSFFRSYHSKNLILKTVTIYVHNLQRIQIAPSVCYSWKPQRFGPSRALTVGILWRQSG